MTFSLPVVDVRGVVNGPVFDQRSPDLLGLLPSPNVPPRRTALLLSLGQTFLECELQVGCWVVHHSKFTTSVGLDTAVVHSLSNPSTI